MVFMLFIIIESEASAGIVYIIALWAKKKKINLKTPLSFEAPVEDGTTWTSVIVQPPANILSFIGQQTVLCAIP